MAVRHYRVTLTAVGPVHIGNGMEYGKKDYFKLDDNTLAILDAPRFVDRLNAEELEEYCEFLEGDSRVGLEDFLLRNHKLRGYAHASIAYQVVTALARARRGSQQHYKVIQFVKDGNGQPYVPGSSVKGMLRTALLTHLIGKDPATYAKLFDREKTRDSRKAGGACSEIEKKVFWVERPEDADAIDIMRYISVSDSQPLNTSDLVFVKKYDKFSKNDSGSHKHNMGNLSNDSYYEGNELNIYRECLRPGTTIKLSLDVDDRIDCFLEGTLLDREGILEVLRRSFELYRERFLSAFDLGDAERESDGATTDDGICRYVIASGPLAGRRCRNKAIGNTGYCNTHQEYATASKQDGKDDAHVFCMLGGGTDFDSKTIVQALFDGRRSIDEIAHILFGQFPTKVDPSINKRLEAEVLRRGFRVQRMQAKYRRDGRLGKGKDDHRHWQDTELGVSPHTVKLGIMGDNKFPMGRCTIQIEEAGK